MEAKLEFGDGCKGTLKSMPGQRLRAVIEAPDNETNRDFLIDALFNLQSRRKRYANPTILQDEDTRDRFPLLTVEAGENDNGGRVFIIKADAYGGPPVFQTFMATRHDLRNAVRAMLCLNRHNGINDRQLEAMPHATEVTEAYTMLLTAVRVLLSHAPPIPATDDDAENKAWRERDPVAYFLEDLRAVYEEARAMFSIVPPIPAIPVDRIAEPFGALPVVPLQCSRCKGTPKSRFKECHECDPRSAERGACEFLRLSVKEELGRDLRGMRKPILEGDDDESGSTARV